MSLMLSLLALGLGGQAADTMSLVRRLEGRWVLAIELPDQTEPVLLTYRSLRNGSVESRGFAYPLGKAAITVHTTFVVQNGKVVVTEIHHGPGSKPASARAEGGKLVTEYESGVRDELTFLSRDLATGRVLAGNKEVARYALRRPAKPASVPVLGGLDPVSLGEGDLTKGDPALRFSLEGWEYRFASSKNLAAFRHDPERYKVQFGGACMNMGPLSGRGSPDLFHTYKGRTYLFASETCRNRFLAAPDDYIDRAEQPVKGTAAGRERLDKLAAAHGGASLDKMRTLVWHRNQPFDSKGVKKPYVTAFALDMAGRYADRQTWDDQVHVSVALPKGGFIGRLDQVGRIDEQERGFLIRRSVRHPIWLLRNRHSPKLAASVLPSVDVPGAGKCDATQVSYLGANTILLSDPSTHELRGIQHFGRGLGAKKLQTRLYTDWTESAGVKLPRAWTVTMEGNAPATGGADQVLVNVGAEGFFARHP